MSSASAARFDPRNMRGMNIESLCKNCLLLVARFDFKNLFIRKFSIPVIEAIVMTALYRCIFIIFVFCANTKMRRVHAWRIIAAMQNNHSIRDLAHKIFIRIAMRSNRFFSWQQKNSVSILIFCASPKPTIISFLNSLGKYILRTKNRIVIQCAMISRVHITSPTKLAANSFWKPTINARNWLGWLISHGVLNLKSCIVCHNHGAGKL